MLKRNYDLVIKGNDWPMWIEGLKSLHEGKSTLIVTENSPVSLNHFLLSELDRRSLIEVGEALNVASLANLDEYIKPAKVRLLLDEKVLVFGENCFFHFQELMRKIPEYYLRHPIFWQSLQEAGEAQFNQFFLENWNHLMKENLAQNSQWSEWPAILGVIDQTPGHPFHFFLEALFQRKIPEGPVQKLAPETAMALLGSWHFLDVKGIEARLKSTYLAHGGEIKYTTIADRQIDQGHLKNILLSSFEGVITPRHLAERQTINTMTSGLKSLVGSWTFGFEWASRFIGEKIYWVDSERLGTNWPWIELEIQNENSFHVELVYWAEAAGRPEFYFEKADDLVYALLERLSPTIPWRQVNVERNYRQSSLSWGPLPVAEQHLHGLSYLGHPSYFTAGQTGLFRSFLPAGV